MQLTICLLTQFCKIIIHIGKVGFGLAMKINSMNDAQDPYEHEEDAMGGNVETKSNGRILQETPIDFAATMRSLRVEMQSYREDNERMIKAQEEQNQLNTAMLQSLTDIQRHMNFGHQEINPEGSRSNTRRIKWSSSGSSDSEESIGGSSSSSHRIKRKRHCKKNSYGEFQKAKPPTFDGEVKNGQEAEAWLLGMRKYLQVQDYSGNMKARVSIFNLTRRESIWWEHFR